MHWETKNFIWPTLLWYWLYCGCLEPNPRCLPHEVCLYWLNSVLHEWLPDFQGQFWIHMHADFRTLMSETLALPVKYPQVSVPAGLLSNLVLKQVNDLTLQNLNSLLCKWGWGYYLYFLGLLWGLKTMHVPHITECLGHNKHLVNTRCCFLAVITVLLLLGT